MALTLKRLSAAMFIGAIGMATLPLALAADSQASDNLAAATRIVDAALAHQTQWTGPTTGPKAQSGKFIVYVASDMKNDGVLGVYKGVKQAAKAIGWKLRVIDGRGTVSGRTSALDQALALNPNGIILGGFDAKEQAADLQVAHKRGVPVVGWHAAPVAGPVNGMFDNITTDANKVAEVAALYAVVKSHGHAGVVIFTDSAFSIAIAKSDAMAKVIKECSGCKLLAVEDTPLADTANRIPTLTSSLLQRFGSSWTYSLGINDLYYDFMVPTLASTGTHLVNISAGDGSVSAFDRIRKGKYQAATVAEPLNLQGWEAVDELNRAFAGDKPYVYSPPVHLVTPQNIMYDGGKHNVFDPDNGYRKEYRKIWGD